MKAAQAEVVLDVLRSTLVVPEDLGLLDQVWDSLVAHEGRPVAITYAPSSWRWKRSFLGACGGIVAALIIAFLTLFLSPLTYNLRPSWEAMCSPGKRTPEGLECTLHIQNNGITPLTGIHVAGLPPHDLVSFLDLSVRQPIGKIAPGCVESHRFTIVVRDYAILAEQSAKLKIRLCGPGRSSQKDYYLVDLWEAVLSQMLSSSRLQTAGLTTGAGHRR